MTIFCRPPHRCRWFRCSARPEPLPDLPSRRDFTPNILEFYTKYHGFYTKTDGFYTENDGFCTKNDGSAVQTVIDGQMLNITIPGGVMEGDMFQVRFYTENDGFTLKMKDFVRNMMDLVRKMMDSVLKMMDFAGPGADHARGSGVYTDVQPAQDAGGYLRRVILHQR